MFREKIKVLDCTIRDGGLATNWEFPEEVVRAVYQADVDAGVDYMEIGYRANKKMFPPSESGQWRYCDDDVVRRVVDGIEGNTKISIMVDIGRVEEDDIAPASESPIDMIRVACYVKDADKAIYLANHAHEKGYETTINIMAISHSLEKDLEEALQQIEEETKVLAVYVVDSFGALYSEQIHFLVDKYASFLKTKEVGIHCHNNQQLGFANTIEAIIHGANFLDASMYGIGRAAGNCPLELLVSFLKNPKFDVRPIIDVISSTFVPMKENIDWGYHIPYMITGTLDEHPRSAMAMMKTPERNNFRKFYDKLKADPELE